MSQNNLATVLEAHLFVQRLASFANWKDLFDKSVTPLARLASAANIEHQGRAHHVRAIESQLRETSGEIALADEHANIVVPVQVKAGRSTRKSRSRTAPCE